MIGTKIGILTYPVAYMGYLLETASTDEIINLLAGYGVEYKDSREQTSMASNSAYAAGSVSVGIGINGKVTFIVDKFGNVYLALGGEVGIKGLSGSVTKGWVQKGHSAQDFEVVIVDEAQLESLLTGWSMVAGGGVGIGGSFIGPFGEGNEGYALTEAGLYYPPQVGAGGAYSLMIYDANAKYNGNREPTLLNSRFDYWYWYHYSQ